MEPVVLPSHHCIPKFHSHTVPQFQWEIPEEKGGPNTKQCTYCKLKTEIKCESTLLFCFSKQAIMEHPHLLQ